MRILDPQRSALRVTTEGIAGAILLGGFVVGAPFGHAADAVDFDAFREAAVPALGRDVQRIEFAGQGWDACMGQPWDVNEGWARWEIRDYRRVIDYAGPASLQTAMRRAGLDPEKLGGCGAQPNAAAARQQTSVMSGSSWSDQLQVWLTPHGFLRLAAANDASVAASEDGFSVTFDVATDGVAYPFRGDYDEDYRLRHVVTAVDDPIFGDMPFEVDLDDYSSFGDVVFPRTIVQKQGGFATLNLSVGEVVAETLASATPAPRDGGRRNGPGGAGSAEPPPFEALGNGVFVMHGAYQSVAVEFEDFSVVIDGLQSDARVREIIRLTKEAIPGKPIRYVVSTHAHFDHANGVREFVAEGATLLTHVANVEFFERALSRPRTLNADATDIEGLPIEIVGVDDDFVLSDDAGQRLELHHIRGSRHARDMLIAFLPRSALIVEADLLQPWISPVFGGKGHPYLVHLAAELQRLGLDYERFVPVHRPAPPPVMSRGDLEAAVE